MFPRTTPYEHFLRNFYEGNKNALSFEPSYASDKTGIPIQCAIDNFLTCRTCLDASALSFFGLGWLSLAVLYRVVSRFLAHVAGPHKTRRLVLQIFQGNSLFSAMDLETHEQRQMCAL